MKLPPQTGDTQAICIDKHDGFIDWCIRLAGFAMQDNAPEPLDADSASKTDRPHGFAA